MEMFSNLPFGCLKQALFCVVGTSLIGEPFLSPDDPFLRHEIRLLPDYGNLSATTGTWPLSLGGISQRLEDDEVEWGHGLVDYSISRESREGFSPFRAKLGLADNRATVRSFGSEPWASFQPGFVTHG